MGFARNLGTALGVIIMLISGGVSFLTIVGAMIGHISEGGVLVMFVSTGFFVISLTGLLSQRRYKKQNYAWYKVEHPECVGAQVKCHACGSDKILLQKLMQHSYTRAHVCSHCGTTLFYSPEV